MEDTVSFASQAMGTGSRCPLKPPSDRHAVKYDASASV